MFIEETGYKPVGKGESILWFYFLIIKIGIISHFWELNLIIITRKWVTVKSQGPEQLSGIDRIQSA